MDPSMSLHQVKYMLSCTCNLFLYAALCIINPLFCFHCCKVTYRVFMDENETAQRLNLSGAYNLEITPDHITLTSADSKVQMARWYYKELKSYGKKTGGLVSFDTGKKAETGEGKFIFQSSCSRELFSVLDANIRKLCQEKNKKDQQEATATVENIKKQKGKVGKGGGFTHSSSSYDTRIEVVEGTKGAYHTKQADPFDMASVYDSLEPTQPQAANATHPKGKCIHFCQCAI